MDWLILIVLVPAVLVPLVLLFGFAGCGSFGTAPPATPTTPDAPSDLKAIAVGEHQINLVWQHPSAGGVEFVVSLTGPGGLDDNHGTTMGKSFESKLLGPGAPLTPGTVFSYQVRARAGGAESGKSNPASAKTWLWKTAYDKPSTSNDNTFAGDCLVQRLDTAVLDYAGTVKQVRLTLAGSVNAVGNPLVIDQVSVSHAATPGTPGNPAPDPWDSVLPLPLLGPVSLPGDGTPLTLPPVEFALDKTRDLVVAFDIGNNNTSSTRKRVDPDVGASVCYTNANTPAAAMDNRPPTGWQARAGSVYLVRKVEVLLTS